MNYFEITWGLIVWEDCGNERMYFSVFEIEDPFVTSSKNIGAESCRMVLSSMRQRCISVFTM